MNLFPSLTTSSAKILDESHADFGSTCDLFQGRAAKFSAFLVCFRVIFDYNGKRVSLLVT